MTTISTTVNIGKKPAPVTLTDAATTKVAELLGEALELGLLRGELQIELLGVDALGGRHEDAPAEQLELEQNLLIRLEEPRVVCGELLGARMLGVRACMLGAEHHLQRDHASPKLFARRKDWAANKHGPRSRDSSGRCRSPPSRLWLADRGQ